MRKFKKSTEAVSAVAVDSFETSDRWNNNYALLCIEVL